MVSQESQTESLADVPLSLGYHKDKCCCLDLKADPFSSLPLAIMSLLTPWAASQLSDFDAMPPQPHPHREANKCLKT